MDLIKTIWQQGTIAIGKRLEKEYCSTSVQERRKGYGEQL